MSTLAALVAGVAVTATGAPAAATPAAALAASCAGCHAGDSALALDDADALFAALQGWRDGDDRAALMSRIARGYSPEELRAMADYLARQ